ncbi:MAG: hypothetical protein ABI120_23465, partial [Gemmatimonadaceae bacterium]
MAGDPPELPPVEPPLPLEELPPDAPLLAELPLEELPLEPLVPDVPAPEDPLAPDAFPEDAGFAGSLFAPS